MHKSSIRTSLWSILCLCTLLKCILSYLVISNKHSYLVSSFRDICHTNLSSLPDSILGGLRTLIAESTEQLKELPSLHLFTKLHEARLTYPSHCCAFQNIHRNRCTSQTTTRGRRFLNILGNRWSCFSLSWETAAEPKGWKQWEIALLDPKEIEFCLYFRNIFYALHQCLGNVFITVCYFVCSKSRSFCRIMQNYWTDLT